MGYTREQREWVNAGLCFECGEPAVSGKKRCVKHISMFRARHNAACIRWQKRNPQKKSEYDRRTREKRSDEIKTYLRKYRKQNRDRIYASQREWDKANPEKRRDHARRSRKKNRESLRQGILRWQQSHAEQTKQKYRRYWNKHRELISERRKDRYHSNLHEARAKWQSNRLKRRKVSGAHTAAQWLARVAYYGWRCRWCGVELNGKTLSKDHVIAISRGGTNWASNLVPSCRSCNSGKCAKAHYTPPARA